MVENVKAMIKKVRNNASPISTWLGGICCIPNEARTKDNTIMIRMKDVINIRIAGAIDNR